MFSVVLRLDTLFQLLLFEMICLGPGQSGYI